jgi:Fur family ferric uptake transcriptional regulator
VSAFSTASPAFTPDARELITRHGGRITRIRVAVVEALLGSTQPLNHDEIAATLGAQGVAHDRVTLYRALDWLVGNGLAQRIAGEERAGRFEIVRAEGHHHAHFHCAHCGQVICLADLSPAVSAALPAGFQLERAELVLHGACAACGKKNI